MTKILVLFTEYTLSFFYETVFRHKIVSVNVLQIIENVSKTNAIIIMVLNARGSTRAKLLTWATVQRSDNCLTGWWVFTRWVKRKSGFGTKTNDQIIKPDQSETNKKAALHKNFYDNIKWPNQNSDLTWPDQNSVRASHVFNRNWMKMNIIIIIIILGRV